MREKLDLLICPPATLLAAAAAIAAPARIFVGGQDCHSQASGAHTGDISAPMLADAGAAFVIVGHSERRADHGESDALVRAKALAALEAGLTPIVCVGETRAQREAGEAEAIVASQIAGSIPAGVAPERLVLAYEPIWAIGTGLTPTPRDVAKMHGFARGRLDALLGDGKGARARILYGGSIKPSNAKELLERRRRRWRAGRRRQPARQRFSRDSRRLSLALSVRTKSFGRKEIAQIRKAGASS